MGDDLDYMHARSSSPLTGRFLSPDPADSAKRDKPQSWNQYAYVLNNPLRYFDANGQEEREGPTAGVIVNNSSEVIWVAGDVGDEMFVIPLNPGESSATYFRDVDAVVIDPGTAGPEGATFGPSIEGQSSGAFKIGMSIVGVEDAGPLSLELDRSAGYAASWIAGRAGFIDASGAKREGWVVPGDRRAAEKKKEELRKIMEERARKRQEEERKKKAQDPVANRPG